MMVRRAFARVGWNLATFLVVISGVGCGDDVVETAPYAVSGVVIDSTTRAGIVGVQVQPATGFSDTTDATGYYSSVIDHDLDEVQVTFIADGYQVAVFTFPTDATQDPINERNFILNVELMAESGE